MDLALRAALLSCLAAACLGYAPTPVARSRVASRSVAVRMDETLFDNIMGDELEREGAEKPWLSETGWALYMDKEAKSSYGMNPRVSDEYKYFTASIFSNPIEVIADFFDGFDEMFDKMFKADYKIQDRLKNADKYKPPEEKKPRRGRK